VFKFLKPADKPAAAGSNVAIAAASEPGAVAPVAAETPGGTFAGKTSADFVPLSGMLGTDGARAALAALAAMKPRSMVFVAAPRTAGHHDAVRALLAEVAVKLPPGPAVVVVHDFDRDGLGVLRLPPALARILAEGVAEAVEMLSVTLPAAFDSDSARVARSALEEELRSGHDAAIEGIKRKAAAQNVGILRTPRGYAVAPLHEGRVVAPDVLAALPGSLKSDVEAKIAVFEGELVRILEDRTALQQDYRGRIRDLDREVASLAVRAALAGLKVRLGSDPAATAYLDGLKDDLVRNAALFLDAAREAGGNPRAPVEIKGDRRLARYRVNVLAAAPAGQDLAACPDALERADLSGEVRAGRGDESAPAGVRPGVLTRSPGGFVMIDARDLMASFNAWTLVKQAMRLGSTVPARAHAQAVSARAGAIALPVEARIAVTGDIEDYRSLCHMDRDGTQGLRLIQAFEPTVALSADTEREFAGRAAALIRDEQLPPFDGPALAAIMHERTDTTTGRPVVSTDLDAVRHVLTLAAGQARAHDRAVVMAEDVLAAMKQRADGLALLAPETILPATVNGVAVR
jgi:AAA domain